MITVLKKTSGGQSHNFNQDIHVLLPVTFLNNLPVLISPFLAKTFAGYSTGCRRTAEVHQHGFRDITSQALSSLRAHLSQDLTRQPQCMTYHSLNRPCPPRPLLCPWTPFFLNCLCLMQSDLPFKDYHILLKWASCLRLTHLHQSILYSMIRAIFQHL